MMIQTSRFGQLEVDPDRLITFEDGILGFPGQKRYALIQTGQESAFYWLQSTTEPDVAFVVCDPRLFVGDYRVPVKLEDLEGLELANADNAQVFVIVNKVGELLTGNFQGPVVVNAVNRRAKQLVLSDRRYSTRHPLMRIPEPAVVAQTA